MNIFKGPKASKGLPNIGNSCYMNSVLQCLKYCDTFTAELNKEDAHQGSFLDIFKKVILGQYKSSEQFYFLKELKESFQTYKKYKKMSSCQEDANEFLLFVLGKLHKELASCQSLDTAAESSENDNKISTIKSLSSIIGEFFIGSVTNMVKCMNCNKEEYHSQYFFCLNIPIIKSKNVYFDDCFEHFVKETETDPSNNVICTECFNYGPVMLKTSINRYPEFLIIHLQRAVFTTSVRTCSDKVVCPVVLMIPKSDKEYIEYSLISFINYSGNAKFGHYTSTCRTQENQWVHFDDNSEIQYISQQYTSFELMALISTMPGGAQISLSARSSNCSSIQSDLQRAYILFYKKQHYE